MRRNKPACVNWFGVLYTVAIESLMLASIASWKSISAVTWRSSRRTATEQSRFRSAPEPSKKHWRISMKCLAVTEGVRRFHLRCILGGAWIFSACVRTSSSWDTQFSDRHIEEQSSTRRRVGRRAASRNFRMHAFADFPTDHRARVRAPQLRGPREGVGGERVHGRFTHACGLPEAST